MTNPINNIRAEIEAEIATFSANAARGASHLSFSGLPSILLRMLDMVEHYAGKGLEIAETDLAAVEAKITGGVKKAETAVVDSAKGAETAVVDSSLVTKVEALAAKVDINSAAIEEVKEVVPALSDEPATDKKAAKKK